MWTLKSAMGSLTCLKHILYLYCHWGGGGGGGGGGMTRKIYRLLVIELTDGLSVFEEVPYKLSISEQ